MGSDEGQHALESYLEQIERATDGGEVVNLEANAAKHYWNEWRELEVRFSKPATVPEHWKTFGGAGLALRRWKPARCDNFERDPQLPLRHPPSRNEDRLSDPFARTRGSTLRGQVIPALLAQREQLDDGRSTGDRKRSRTMQKRWARNQQWDRTAGKRLPEDLDFEEEILPGLQNVKIREIAEVTGLSMSYSSAIRSGKYVPHRRHWGRLKEVAS